jgi:hypothetical protein
MDSIYRERCFGRCVQNSGWKNQWGQLCRSTPETALQRVCQLGPACGIRKFPLERRVINQNARSEIGNDFLHKNIKVPEEVMARKFDRILRIKWFRLHNIEKVSDRVMDGVIPQDALAMGGWSPSLNSEDKNVPESVPEKVWRTLVANHGPDGANAPSWYRNVCLECLTLHHLVNHDSDLNTSQSQNGDNTLSAIDTFLENVQSVVWNRRFFLTEEARSKSVLFGLAPPTSEAGNAIFIFVWMQCPGSFNPTYNILICTSCKYIIHSIAITRHSYNNHKTAVPPRKTWEYARPFTSDLSSLPRRHCADWSEYQ